MQIANFRAFEIDVFIIAHLIGEDDALPIIIGTGRKTKTAIQISMHRILLPKKLEKIVVEKNEFNVDCTFDNQLMIEIFSGKLAVFHDEAMLFIEAARVGRTNILESMLEVNPDLDINATNFRKESALILAVKNSHEASVNLLLKTKGIDAHIKDGKGSGTLHWMAQNGDQKIVKLILNQYVSTNVS